MLLGCELGENGQLQRFWDMPDPGRLPVVSWSAGPAGRQGCFIVSRRCWMNVCLVAGLEALRQ